MPKIGQYRRQETKGPGVGTAFVPRAMPKEDPGQIIAKGVYDIGGDRSVAFGCREGG